MASSVHQDPEHEGEEPGEEGRQQTASEYTLQSPRSLRNPRGFVSRAGTLTETGEIKKTKKNTFISGGAEVI